MGLRLSVSIYKTKTNGNYDFLFAKTVAQNGWREEGGNRREKKNLFPGKLGSSSFPVILSRNKIFTASSLISTFRNFQSVFIGNI